MYHVRIEIEGEVEFEGMAELRYSLGVIEAYFEDGCVAAPIHMITKLEVL